MKKCCLINMILLTTDSVSVKARTRGKGSGGGGGTETMSPSFGKFSFLPTEVNILLEVGEDVDRSLGDGVWMKLFCE